MGFLFNDPVVVMDMSPVAPFGTEALKIYTIVKFSPYISSNWLPRSKLQLTPPTVTVCVPKDPKALKVKQTTICLLGAGSPRSQLENVNGEPMGKVAPEL